MPPLVIATLSWKVCFQRKENVALVSGEGTWNVYLIWGREFTDVHWRYFLKVSCCFLVHENDDNFCYLSLREKQVSHFEIIVFSKNLLYSGWNRLECLKTVANSFWKIHEKCREANSGQFFLCLLSSFMEKKIILFMKFWSIVNK